jgi:hypothetical protein
VVLEAEVRLTATMELEGAAIQVERPVTSILMLEQVEALTSILVY